jgi:starch phosphorylase
MSAGSAGTIQSVHSDIADLPEKLTRLARNLWWTWHPEVVTIFRDLDPELWREVNHNPILLLQRMDPDRLAQRAREQGLEGRILDVARGLDLYCRGEDTWARTRVSKLRVWPVAYFSFEFGLHECLPTYAGGLGILAGDHLKSASDLGVPIVGVGLLYTEGYFQQRLDADGWQHEEYSPVDKGSLPLEPVLTPGGDRLLIDIPILDRIAKLQVWRARVGRSELYLLDSNLPQNTPEDQQLTGRLYEAAPKTRIRQEIALGVGGIRTLAAIGRMPGVVHCNEGHSAFALSEWLRLHMIWEGVGFDQARHHVGRRAIFTTHTPIPAGHDHFDPELAKQHLGFLAEGMRLSMHDLLGLGRVNPKDTVEPFCMTVLALKIAHRANGVSALHGRVSRNMWRPLWNHRSEQEVPIGHITNGVHVPSWLAPPMYQLYERHFGSDWTQQMERLLTWKHVSQISDEEFWEAHQISKERLIQFVRRRLAAQRQYRGEPQPRIDEALQRFDPGALTIGFARRFAEYKRATLPFHDLDRLERILTHDKRPVQIIFAGKAHPANEIGKRNIQRIVGWSRDPRFRGRVAFIENYDMGVGRHLVQGVDVWLNNPLKPLEACGTSGQKVVLNGGLNLSVLDGWWAEAYDGSNGFAIGYGGYHPDQAEQFRRDAAMFYDVLEKEVVPLYYERDEHGIPHRWLERVRWAVATLGWRFSADRMVADYFTQDYLPADGAVSCDARSFRALSDPS